MAIPDKQLALAKQILRFGTSSALALGFKAAAMWVCIQFIPALVAYVIVHFAVFFFSFFLHSRLTFSSSVTWANLGRYFRAVFFIKLADYLIFSVAFVYFKVDALWSLVVATLVITVARFFLIRTALFKNTEPELVP